MFENMSVSDLKTYLRERGVSVNGYLKPALIEIAKAVQKMMLPIVTEFEKGNDNQDVHNFIIHDMEIRDPFSASRNLVNNFVDSPPFGLYDIFNHLIFYSSEYDKQGLAAYKAFDEYRMFQDGYVESLLTETISKAGVHLSMGKVKPAMKEKTDDGKLFYDCWFMLEGKGANRGSVLKARCLCKGGRDGGCKHIAALMYSLEDLLNTRDNDSPTNVPCMWSKKPTTDSRPCDVKDLKIKRCEQPLKKHKKEHVYCEHIDVDVRHEDDRDLPTTDAIQVFAQSLEKTGMRPTILPLLTKLYSQPQEASGNTFTDGEKVINSEEKYGILEKKLLHVCDKLGGNCVNEPGADILVNLTHTQEEINFVSSVSVKQWKSKEWYKQKSGFITGSIAQQSVNMQNSLDKGLKRKVSSLVDKITNQQARSSKLTVCENPQNPRDWGLKHEESARLSYYKVECKKHHKLSLIAKGFLPSRKKPFVGASVDNIRTCCCEGNCPDVVVEYKCPWKHRHVPPKEAFVSPEIGGEMNENKFALKNGSRYYMQVQLQMFVTELDNCDFVVWTEHGVLSVPVKYDKIFMENALVQLERFWMHHVLPVLAQRLVNTHKGRKTIIKIGYLYLFKYLVHTSFY